MSEWNFKALADGSKTVMCIVFKCILKYDLKL